MSRSIVIVGGGIVGASTALFLARKDWSVTLIEKNSVGGGASTAAAGILSPPFFLDPDEPDEEQNTQPLLSRKGYDFYPTFLDVLSEYTSEDVGYEVAGMWYLAFNEDEYEEQRTIHREMKKFNRQSEWFEAEAIRGELNYLSPEVQGGLFFEEEAQVDPDRLLTVLREALLKEGVELLEQTPVRTLEVNEDVPTVLTPDDEYRGDALLLAAGAWSRELGQQIGVEVPIEPRKGEMLSVQAPELEGKPPVRHGERFVLPRNDEAILGSTTEDAGFNTQSTAGAMQDLLASGINIVPHLAEASFTSAWAGLRPYANKKGGAFLGPVPGTENVFMACGHYKTGVLQGPFTGRVMADHISGSSPDLDVSRYSLDRS
ncbi:MAG: NAD(P)/FAD-dependent oxidoreductase [bacterium]